MALWLIRSDPDVRSFSDLAEEGWKGTEWHGVRDEEAFDLLAAMQPKDLALFYHTGDENRFFGIVKIMGPAHADSTDDSGQWLSVDIAVFLRLITQVTLEQVKADKRLSAFANEVENGIDIQAVALEDWTNLCELAGMPKTPLSG